jgi:hypothetical protein
LPRFFSAPKMKRVRAFVEDKGKFPVLNRTWGVIPGREGAFLGSVGCYPDVLRPATTTEPVLP